MTGAPPELLLLLHPTEPLVLAGADPGEPLQLPAGRFWPLGPDLTQGEHVLVRVGVARDEDPVPGARWVDRPPAGWPEPLATVAAEALAQDAGRAPVPALRPAWMRRGWWQQVTAWCDTVLAAGCAGPGVARTADPEPVQHWVVSAVARVPTTAGPCWLKAVPAYFAREAAVLELLGATVPGRVPRLLASRREPDGGALLLLADAGSVQPDEVDDGERLGLAALVAQVQADTLPVLGHGDLHVWNVLRDPDGGPGRVLIDWTDACVGPPGLDLAALHDRDSGEDARAAARDRYVTGLAGATGTSSAALDRAVRVTGTAARLVQVCAHEEILAHTEPAGREYFARWAVHWLRELIPPSS